MTELLETSSHKFDINDAGFRRMNAGRSAGHLVREAVSNSFDNDGVRNVYLTVTPGEVVIEDDSSEGIKDWALITTVFLTNKEDCPTKRGRKGRGLKELISAVDWAEVDTTGHRVVFSDAGRQVFKSDRTVGTRVHVKNPEWDDAKVAEILEYINKFIPPSDIKLHVNGTEIAQRHMVHVEHNVYMRTQVVKDNIQVEKYNYTSIQLFKPNSDEKPYIYEMGVPIQENDSPYHINVLQRVPLNDNRDQVDTYYLKTLYGSAVIPHAINIATDSDLTSEWFEQGIRYAGTMLQRQALTKLYGPMDRLCILSHSKNANDVAKQNGFILLDLDAMSYAYREIATGAEIASSVDIAKRLDKEQACVPVATSEIPGGDVLSDLIKFLGFHILKRTVTTGFFKRDEDFSGYLRLAHFIPADSRVEFNVKADFNFRDPLSPKLLSTIVHEFAHNAHDDHGDDFHREVERISGNLGSIMVRYHKEINDIVRTPSANSAGKVLIKCIDCAAFREIDEYNVGSVKRCVACSKKHKRSKK